MQKPTDKNQIELSVSRGATINVGNYESERIDVSIAKKIQESDKEKEYEQILKWTEKKIKDRAKAITGREVTYD